MTIAFLILTWYGPAPSPALIVCVTTYFLVFKSLSDCRFCFDLLIRIVDANFFSDCPATYEFIPAFVVPDAIFVSSQPTVPEVNDSGSNEITVDF